MTVYVYPLLPALPKPCVVCGDDRQIRVCPVTSQRGVSPLSVVVPCPHPKACPVRGEVQP